MEISARQRIFSRLPECSMPLAARVALLLHPPKGMQEGHNWLMRNRATTTNWPRLSPPADSQARFKNYIDFIGDRASIGSREKTLTAQNVPSFQKNNAEAKYPHWSPSVSRRMKNQTGITAIIELGYQGRPHGHAKGAKPPRAWTSSSPASSPGEPLFPLAGIWPMLAPKLRRGLTWGNRGIRHLGSGPGPQPEGGLTILAADWWCGSITVLHPQENSVDRGEYMLHHNRTFSASVNLLFAAVFLLGRTAATSYGVTERLRTHLQAIRTWVIIPTTPCAKRPWSPTC